MKKILLATIILASSFFIWKLISKPEFKGKGSALQESIWEWERADSDKEKLEIAERLVFYSNARKVLSDNNNNNPSYTLSDEEESFIASTEEYYNNLLALASRFEKSLSLDEIKQITKNNPNSIFLRTKSFYTNPPKRKCSKSEYDRLRETHTAEELYMRGSKIGAIIEIYEQKHRASYIENLIALIKKNNSKYSNYSRLAELYYPYISKPSKFANKIKRQLSLFSDEDNQRLENYEEDLVKTGVERSKIAEYVLSFAAKSPDCLSRFSFEFVKMARAGLTMERGQMIISAIQEKAKNEGKLPESIYDIKGEVKDLYMDGHSQGFYIKSGKNVIQLFSYGDDYEENTGDDILIGEVYL